ncbi:MAG: hypothetical protein K5888_09275 [Lachnospiraceae bacterium]|nr:hypothetical protein [Lachnospiraceae bacterium]
MIDEKIKQGLSEEDLEKVTGGTQDDITELHCCCKGCMDITVWKRVYGTWHCTICYGTETIPYYELPQYKK